MSALNAAVHMEGPLEGQQPVFAARSPPSVLVEAPCPPPPPHPCSTANQKRLCGTTFNSSRWEETRE